MAKISLRAYIGEIENMIDSGRTDEAIAHSRYILQKFPKHIDSYRLLGKAYLEIQRYSDASDILQRVLSSVPDDFVAHLGMSIIREDEGNLDAAIWHMERAFEVQPSNAAVQAELKRLYGRRDGLEPPKVHLTRGALARMYAKGNLHRQAIAELRTALSEDSQRPDLLVLLAQMYKETGQRVEAVETCSHILSKLPHCYEANKILAEILPGTERASEAKIYQQRINALNPYATHISPSHPSAKKVPDSAVTIEKYEWTPGESLTDSTEQPDWAASLGVDISEEAEEGDMPDWLAIASEGEQPDSEPEEAEKFEGQPAASGEEEMPEWLSAEEEETQPEQRASLVESEEETPPAEDLAPAEIPDWLRSMAPSEEEASQEAASGDKTAFTWSEEEDAEAEAIDAFEIDEEAEVEVPDWLRELDDEKTTEELEIEEAADQEIAETEAPDWMTDEAAQIFEEDEEIPDWLKELEEEREETQPESSEIEMEAQAAAAEVEEAEMTESPEGELPEWLQEEQNIEFEAEAEEPEWSLESEEAALEAGQIEETSEVEEMEPQEDVEALEMPAEPEVESLPEGVLEDEDAALAWLESLAQRQGAAEEELLTTADKRRETPPDWIEDLSEQEEEEEEFALEEELSFEELADSEVADIEEETYPEPEGEPSEEEIPEWLRAAEAQEEDPGEAEELPEWMRGAEEGPPPEEVAEVIEEGTEEEELEAEISEWLQETSEEQALPDWLSDFEGELDEEEIAELREEEVAPSKVESELVSGEEREIPDWLREPGEEEEPELQEESPELAQPEEEVLPEEEPILGDTKPVRVGPAEAETEPAEVEAEFEEEVEEFEVDEEVDFRFEAVEEEPEMAWQESLAAEAAEEEMVSPRAEVEEEPEPEATEVGLEEAKETVFEVREDRSEEALEDIPEEEVELEAEVEEDTTEPEPGRLIEINTASLAELERIPGIGFTMAQNIIAHRETYGPLSSFEELQNVTGIGPVIAEELKNWVSIEEKPEAIPAPEDPHLAALQEARQAIYSGNIDEAINQYNGLIKQEQLLEEVIDDLRTAIDNHPEEIDLYQALGDAYVRNDQLDEALEAYTTAEELLR